MSFMLAYRCLVGHGGTVSATILGIRTHEMIWLRKLRFSSRGIFQEPSSRGQDSRCRRLVLGEHAMLINRFGASVISYVHVDPPPSNSDHKG